MRILLWHVHGSWTTAFVQGPHTYLVPVLPERGPDGLGRAATWDWPGSVEEVTPAQAARPTSTSSSCSAPKNWPAWPRSGAAGGPAGTCPPSTWSTTPPTGRSAQ